MNLPIPTPVDATATSHGPDAQEANTANFYDDRRCWSLPEQRDVTPSNPRVLARVRYVLTGLWCPTGTAVDKVCSHVSQLFAEVPRPAAAQLLRRAEPDHADVWLAVVPRPAEAAASDVANRRIAAVVGDLVRRV